MPDANGAAITDYIVEQSADGATGWTVITDSGGVLTTHTVTGLTNDVVHYFRVAAVNAIGQGSWSNVISATPVPPGGAEVLQHIMDAGWFDPAADKITFPNPLTNGSTIALILWTHGFSTAPSNITTSAGHTFTLQASNNAIGGGMYSYFYTAPNTSTADDVIIERNDESQRWGMAAWEVQGTLSQIVHSNINSGSSPYSATTMTAMTNGGVVLAYIADDGNDVIHLTNPTESFYTVDGFPRTPMSSGHGTVAPATTFTATGTSTPTNWPKQFWAITYESGISP